jgi:uncharacterized protein (TIGR02265 family)
LDRPLVYDSAFESLRRALGKKLDAPAVQRFKALGVDFDRKLEPAYSLDTSVAVLRFAGQLFAPGLAENDAMQKLGRAITASFTETMVGKALFATLRVLGTKRGLTGLQRSLRMNNNYVTTKLTEVGPNEVELWCGPVTFPTYYQGIFAQGLEATGAKGVRVELKARDENGATYLVRWG